jgi:hypothetical protein
MDTEPQWPRWMFPAGAPTEPNYGGRCFESKAELDAVGGQWYATPQEAQAAEPDPEPSSHPRRRH